MTDEPNKTSRWRALRTLAAAWIIVLVSLLTACSTTRQETTRSSRSASMTATHGIVAAHEVIDVYPSAHLPPVANPYFFYWDFGSPPKVADPTVDVEGVRTDQEAARLEKQGILPVNWLPGPNWRYGKDYKDFFSKFSDSIKANRAYLVDEWQSIRLTASPGSALAASDPFGMRGTIDGILDAKHRNPSSFVIIAWRGENSLKPLVEKDGADLVAIEAYTSVSKDRPTWYAVSLSQVDRRIALARSWGILDRTIPWLGHILPYNEYHASQKLTPQELERQIKHYREIAPQMPGVAFFGNENEALAKVANELTRKYFIDPAPSVRITTPMKGAHLSATTHVVRIAARAKDGRVVVQYKGYIDNRLVYEGTSSAFSWNFSKETPGVHYITVHAIDNDWNRAAAQIRVVCK